MKAGDVLSARQIGYFKPGHSWLHRRHPVTKLLALISTIFAAFLLPTWALPALLVLVTAVAISTGLAVETLRSLRLPAVLFLSILVVNALFYPGAVDRIFAIGPVGLSWEGIVYGLVSAAA